MKTSLVMVAEEAESMREKERYGGGFEGGREKEARQTGGERGDLGLILLHRHLLTDVLEARSRYTSNIQIKCHH